MFNNVFRGIKRFAGFAGILVVGLLFIDAGAAQTTVINDTFDDVIWPEGTTQGDWYVEFNGLGDIGAQKIAGRHGRVLWEKPKASTSTGETHASLVTSIQRFSNFTLTADVTTAQQLRTGSPANSWEVAWVVWDHHTVSGQHRFYYFLLKPNGWEFGKADPTQADPYHQTFLVTDSTPNLTVGAWNRFKVTQRNGKISVWANGVKMVDNYQDVGTTDSYGTQITPYSAGSIGFYSEDAYIMVDNVIVKR